VDFPNEINKCKLEDRVIVGQLRETCSTKIVDLLNASQAAYNKELAP